MGREYSRPRQYLYIHAADRCDEQADVAGDCPRRGDPTAACGCLLHRRHSARHRRRPKSVDLLRIYLTEAGYAVEVAQDGAEGLEKVKRLAPDVVILDVLLPKVDGWAFLSQVKSDPATKDIPVIIVSIVDQKGKGFALGAADYLIKPINKEGTPQKAGGFQPGLEGAHYPGEDSDD